MQQMERLGALHKEALDRMDQEMAKAKEELKESELQAEIERRERENVVQDTNKQRIENERKKHAKEEELMQNHHGLLQKVVDLERQLGEQQTDQMREMFKLEQVLKTKESDLRSEYTEKVQDLKQQTITVSINVYMVPCISL